MIAVEMALEPWVSADQQAQEAAQRVAAAGGEIPVEIGEPPTSTLSELASTTRFDLRVVQSLRRIIRAVDLHSRKLLAQHDITGPQLVCLLSVEEHERMTPSAIARHVHLSSSTVIGILDRLQAKGLVQRERDLKDRRLVQVALTEQGKALVTSAPSPLQDTLADAMNDLPVSEKATIAESLDRIVEMMEVRHIDAAPILETGLINPALEEANVLQPPG
jgi:DNA-binding MarR family transcriptional regulator